MAVADPSAPLCLTAAQHAELAALYGDAVIAKALAHDCFANVAALRRQLAHEAKTEITLADYDHIAPFLPAGDDRIEQSVVSAAGSEPGAVASLERTSVVHADGAISQRSISRNARGECIALNASGRFGVPPGWTAEDKMSRGADGVLKLRTRFIGPAGESGVVVRSFDGTTLHLDKAYKSTLPTRLAGVPGFARPVATVNYMTARACRILGVTAQNLQQIKVNRLQHRPTLVHLDWLMRNNPGKSIAELIDHSTWAKTYIRQTAEIVGRRTAPGPAIEPEGSRAWQAAHPGAPRRDWSYLQRETERLTFKHLTRQKIVKVDDATGCWETSAAMALACYKAQQCEGLSPGEAARRSQEIDALLQARLAAIGAEESGLRSRYGMAPQRVPAQINFDVTYRTIAHET